MIRKLEEGTVHIYSCDYGVAKNKTEEKRVGEHKIPRNSLDNVMVNITEPWQHHAEKEQGNVWGWSIQCNNDHLLMGIRRLEAIRD